MPVVATPVTPIIVTTDQIRRFMIDFPNKNLLLDDVEFAQADIDQGVELVTSRFNSITPQSNLSEQGWPKNLQYVLLLGVAAYLIKSCTFLQLRNQATYQDGDIAPIGIDDKFPMYVSLWQSLDSEWLQLVTRIKTQNNLEGAYGGLSSGYRNVSRFHHS